MSFVVLEESDCGDSDVEYFTAHGPFNTYADAKTFADRFQDRIAWVLEMEKP